MQLRTLVERVTREVLAMPPPEEPAVEELRMRYRPIGCWATA